MLDFVISYIKKLELFCDLSSDEDSLEMKKQFSKFYHINENDSWSDRDLSLEEKEEFVQTVFNYYSNDDVPWILQLAIGKITENELTELYKS
jgi:hypothetical protein